jgi:hypothetical protein
MKGYSFCLWICLGSSGEGSGADLMWPRGRSPSGQDGQDRLQDLLSDRGGAQAVQTDKTVYQRQMKGIGLKD